MKHPLTLPATINAYGTVQFKMDDVQKVASLFAGQEVDVEIRKHSKRRTNGQNAYYWGVMVPAIRFGFEGLGERLTEEEVHGFLKHRHLPRNVVNPETSEVLGTIGGSTKGLSTNEFSDYLEQCFQFAAETLGVAIPDPKTVWGMEERETRQEYLKRIGGYVAEMPDAANLLKYFNQNPDWANDAEIKALFTQKKIELQSSNH